MPDIVPPKEYPDFLKNVLARIRAAQHEAIKAVNYHQLAVSGRYSASEILQPLVAEIGWSYHQPIGVATYTIQQQLPDKWKKLLPSVEQLEKHFKLIQQLNQTRNDSVSS